jgi:L-rhamnonate dehydratase
MPADLRIVRIEKGRLEGKRPRHAGSNARLGPHGDTVRPSVVRITTESGASGWGYSSISRDLAETFLGMPFNTAFSSGHGGTTAAFRAIDYPLWDLAGKLENQPVHALVCESGLSDTPLSAPCYDTSLYFDDLHLDSDEEAAALLASEARDGYERGHRAFKLKVGRGAMHMPLEAGTRRDIAVIRAVREAVGPEPPIMLDANNGYNLNLTQQVLGETADCGIFWIEEAFHEDATLYLHLKNWLKANNLPILIADGEGEASPSLMRWAAEGIIDVVQYDIFGHGFTTWLNTAKELDARGARSAPHHYGMGIGNYISCHLAPAIQNFTFVEWDEAVMVGVDASGYRVENGRAIAPNTPGFGLGLDEEVFAASVAKEGFTVSLS